MKTRKQKGYAKRPNGYTAKELAAKYQVELKVLQLMLDPKQMGKLTDFTRYLRPLSKADTDRVIRFLYGEVVRWLQSGKPVHYIPYRVFAELNDSLPESCHLGEVINAGFGGDNGMKTAFYSYGELMILFR